MGDYDRIIKENIEAIFLPLLEKFTGIRVAESTEIKHKVQRTLEREPDFLKKIVDSFGKEFILQLEFQTQNDSEMVYRMAEYKAILQRKYQLPVRQFVIFLGMDQPNMKTELDVEEQIKGFEIQNIHDLSPNDLAASQIPEEIILTILSNYSKSDANAVISSIIAKLQALSTSQVELEGYLKQLIILSRLRKLEIQTRKKVEDMPITYDITTDGLYRQGIEQGIEQGKYQAISNLIKQGLLTDQQIAEAMNVALADVHKVRDTFKK